tara:strand:+ start:4285 stop:4839 length:555 start_codon:yes stop_codon:yes gene_type:complete
MPEIFTISDSLLEKEDLHNFIKFLSSRNLKIIQFRMKNLDLDDQKRQLLNAKEMCSKYNLKLVVNSFHNKINIKKVEGLHLTSADLMKVSKEGLPDIPIIGASCHNLEQVHKANILNLNYIYLSPVLETRSHESLQPLGWKNFRKLSNLSKIPVFALGGMSLSDLNTAKKNGAYGIAGISFFKS